MWRAKENNAQLFEIMNKERLPKMKSREGYFELTSECCPRQSGPIEYGINPMASGTTWFENALQTFFAQSMEEWQSSYVSVPMKKEEEEEGLQKIVLIGSIWVTLYLRSIIWNPFERIALSEKMLAPSLSSGLLSVQRHKRVVGRQKMKHHQAGYDRSQYASTPLALPLRPLDLFGDPLFFHYMNCFLLMY